MLYVHIALTTLMPQLLDKMRGLVRKVAEKKPQLLNKFFVASAIKSLDEHKVKVKKKSCLQMCVYTSSLRPHTLVA